ncbi:uncharacterized protein LOC116604491 [Nematostella vectensis]|uniref:uncharacterized protein LOC116604491 n=1 Tax=Nematostella vectensis TaxID=45351 RepID=UPI002076E21D|nr:uncharacterized protein LOC116604491 [Nematostella vectensis]
MVEPCIGNNNNVSSSAGLKESCVSVCLSSELSVDKSHESERVNREISSHVRGGEETMLNNGTKEAQAGLNLPGSQPSTNSNNGLFDSGEHVARVLSQAMSTPRIEYMHFDGNPINYVSFMHNFETCLESLTSDNSRKLQYLIQHCTGKARDAIESCVNLPTSEGYNTAKNTLKENFGLPHIIAKAHLKRLQDLPPLRNGGGPALLEFSRHLEVAHRTLSGMGSDYVSELNYTSTLRELNNKLPYFMKGKWTERAGRIIESGSRPNFSDFLKFIKERAKLVNNEFGDDLVSASSQRGKKGNNSDKKQTPRSSMATGVTPPQNSEQRQQRGQGNASWKCVICSGPHGLWKCAQFKELNSEERNKLVLSNRLCFKCLSGGHFRDTCPKTTFKCQVKGCGKEHHTLLHFSVQERKDNTVDNKIDKSPGQARPNASAPETTGVNAGSTSVASVSVATGAGERRVCLGVIPVKVKVKGDDRVLETYALLDSGSEVSLCKEQLFTDLGCDGIAMNFELAGVTGTRKLKGHMVDLVVMSQDGMVESELLNVRTVKEIPVSSSCIPRREDVEQFTHLRSINLQECGASEVGLIIGLKENPLLFVPLEYKAGNDGEPVGVRYSLGWTVMGPMCGKRDSDQCSVNLINVANKQFPEELYNEKSCLVAHTHPEDTKLAEHDGTGAPQHCSFKDNVSRTAKLKTADLEIEKEIDKEVLQQQLERLWQTDFADSVVSSNVCPSIENKRALEIMEDTLEIVDGHCQVALPWRRDPPYLPYNKSMAERRCGLLKKRFLRDGVLFDKYKETMNDYIERGHAEKVPAEELARSDGRLWYLSHHPVTHPLKKDKVRIVFDCAAKYGGTSLNEQLLQGPDLTNNLVAVLSRFREEKIGLVANVESMFHQVRVNPKDCDALRFLWWPNSDLSGELEEYRMVKHLFGATSSPSVVNYCLKKTIELKDNTNPEVSDAIVRNMYVDDLMKSTDTTENAVKLVSDIREVLDKGGFNLTKWCSNDKDVIASVPEKHRAKSMLNELERPTTSTLGLKWNVEDDQFVWDVADSNRRAKEKPATKRSVLSIVYSLFDPLGFIAPYTMKGKLLLQVLTRKQVGWDDPMNPDDSAQWMRWVEDLPKLEEVKVDRCFKPKDFKELKDAQLHVFSDASRQGYSAVAYLRLEDVEGRKHCSFVMGKARLAPLREISIPRLELTAAVISVKLSKIIREELDLKVNKVNYWTDSMSVLKCINNETKRFHTFESNRLTIIHDGSNAGEWRYVNRDDNPADDGSKGLKMDTLIRNDRWLKGPSFLLEDDADWPKVITIPEITDDDPEVRKEAQVYVTCEEKRRNVINDIIMYHSSWQKLKLSIAWLLRYKQFLRSKVLQRKEAQGEHEKRDVGGLMTVEELQEAECIILRHVQREEFPDERLHEKSDKSISKLCPQKGNGLIRVGGRIGKAQVDYELRHPIILPYKNHVTDLIIMDHHQSVGHMGQESVLSSLRNEYWVIKGRSAVRRVIGKCLKCQRRRAKPMEQFMADLPAMRVAAEEPPFTYVGVDYFGPMEVKVGRSKVKRYGCLFSCLSMRAVHVEITHSMDTDSMINALRRFISLRGYPKEIHSDNGTNFTKADKELKQALGEWDLERINRFCIQRRIKWSFIPPAASHMGGAWERMVQTTKRVLKSLLNEQIVSDEVLLTVMAETVNIINSRPLTSNSDDIEDEMPLTPNHLLHLRPTPSVPPGVFGKEDMYCRRAWRQAQYLSNRFWRRWTSEYLPTLMERTKWTTVRENLKEGDVVLLADENFRRGEWPLARVMEVLPSSDGRVRSAMVKTVSTVATRAKRRRRGDVQVSSTKLTRPVTRLCKLEMDN